VRSLAAGQTTNIGGDAGISIILDTNTIAASAKKPRAAGNSTGTDGVVVGAREWDDGKKNGTVSDLLSVVSADSALGCIFGLLKWVRKYGWA